MPGDWNRQLAARAAGDRPGYGPARDQDEPDDLEQAPEAPAEAPEEATRRGLSGPSGWLG